VVEFPGGREGHGKELVQTGKAFGLVFASVLQAILMNLGDDVATVALMFC